ncbi:MAG: sialidase family protein [Phycisphaeraceae bacterium]
MNTNQRTAHLLGTLVLFALTTSCALAADSIYVESGAPKAVKEEGGSWKRGDAYLEKTGEGPILFADQAAGKGDLHIKLTLAITNLTKSAASFTFEGKSHFGFEGGSGAAFLQGPLFGEKTIYLEGVAEKVPVGKPFDFEVTRKDGVLRFAIDGKEIYSHKVGSDPLGRFGVRPWRSTMRVYTFTANGNLVAPPKDPGWATGVTAESVDVFVAGTENYHTFRIPSIIQSAKGTLLAFCEGRKIGRGDSGDIDLVMKRSTDGGKTWSKLQVIWDHENNTCGNPAPVVDTTTGRIWLPLTWNLGSDHEGAIKAGTSKHPRLVYMSYSDDDGLTWTQPKEMPGLRKDYWRWYATGPDKGIQLTQGPHKGRLVIPCNHSDHRDAKLHPFRSHVIYSDDHGKTWQIGGVLDPATNESTIVELEGGMVLDNMRSYHGKQRRAVAVSKDGGETFSEVTLDDALIEPVCQASILRYTWKQEKGADGKGRIVFCNPASKAREKLTLRVSYDDGKTWAVSRELYTGSAAYSCLTRVAGSDDLGVLFERDNYSRITFVRVTREWLEGKFKSNHSAEPVHSTRRGTHSQHHTHFGE